MNWENVDWERRTKMEQVAEHPVQCRHAVDVAGPNVSCRECPFPFCVEAEARIIKGQVRMRAFQIMRELGKTMNEISEGLNLTMRSVYRYKRALTNAERSGAECVWCEVLRLQNTLCMSDIYAVVVKDGTFIIVLNRHRHASKRELDVIKSFAEYAFPGSASAMEKGNGNHDHWSLGSVALEEAKRFKSMCEALDQYTLSLNKALSLNREALSTCK